METSIREFCIKYKEKLKNDQDIADNPIEIYSDKRARISFHLVVKEYYPLDWSSQLYKIVTKKAHRL